MNYWINTRGNKIILFSLTKSVPVPKLVLMYKLVRCNWFEYFLFKKTRINLKAEDKFQWVKSYWRNILYGTKTK